MSLWVRIIVSLKTEDQGMGFLYVIGLQFVGVHRTLTDKSEKSI